MQVSRESLKGPLGLSLVAIVLLGLVTAVYAPALMEAMSAPSYRTSDATNALSRQLEMSDEQRRLYRDRFAGRSIFFRPPAPPRQPEPEVPDEPEDDPDPPPPPAPTGPPPAPETYQGPKPIAIFGRDVWFEDDLHLRVGEEPNDGLAVLEANAPWSIRVSYQHGNHEPGEYEVALFDRDPMFANAEGGGGSASMPGLITRSADGTNDDNPPTRIEIPDGGERQGQPDRSRRPGERGSRGQRGERSERLDQRRRQRARERAGEDGDR